MITTTSIIRNAPAPFDGEVSLDYEGRLLQRRKLTSTAGAFLVDLPGVITLEDGDAFELSDGRKIVVRAKPEPVMVIRGHLARLAWHIGNRHIPCRIEADRLIIREDPALETMLRKLGAEIYHKTLPFRPQGGPYGYERSSSRDHGTLPDQVHAHDASSVDARIPANGHANGDANGQANGYTLANGHIRHHA